MNNKKDLSLEDLKDLLLENDITNFDPVAEAYRVFDQTGEGALSGDKLREAFMAYGMGELADEELDILIRVRIVMNTVTDPCNVCSFFITPSLMLLRTDCGRGRGRGDLSGGLQGHGGAGGGRTGSQGLGHLRPWQQ